MDVVHDSLPLVTVMCSECSFTSCDVLWMLWHVLHDSLPLVTVMYSECSFTSCDVLWMLWHVVQDSLPLVTVMCSECSFTSCDMLWMLWHVGDDSLPLVTCAWLRTCCVWLHTSLMYYGFPLPCAWPLTSCDVFCMTPYLCKHFLIVQYNIMFLLCRSAIWNTQGCV